MCIRDKLLTTLFKEVSQCDLCDNIISAVRKVNFLTLLIKIKLRAPAGFCVSHRFVCTLLGLYKVYS